MQKYTTMCDPKISQHLIIIIVVQVFQYSNISFNYTIIIDFYVRDLSSIAFIRKC